MPFSPLNSPLASPPASIVPKLDSREQHFRVEDPLGGQALFLRYLLPARAASPEGRVVLYVHGGTFPSALSIAHRFAGRSWRDALGDDGFHVWGLDFPGFGCYSDPYPELAEPADRHAPLGRSEIAVRHLERAVRFIVARHGLCRISLIAHSWGSIVAGALAGRCPELVDRLVLFGPIARRADGMPLPRLPAWRLISLRDQWERFVADVPPAAAPVLDAGHFAVWGEAYLDTDSESRGRHPPAVKTPCGPFQDIIDAWGGSLAYDPARIRAPVAILRGEWDSLCTDRDADWLCRSLSSAPLRRDIKLARGTHLMHLESGRAELYRRATAFLQGYNDAT